MWAEQNHLFLVSARWCRLHRSRNIFSLLCEHFGNQVIVLDFKKYFKGCMNWSSYSSDLNPCDFFVGIFKRSSVPKATFKLVWTWECSGARSLGHWSDHFEVGFEIICKSTWFCDKASRCSIWKYCKLNLN